MSVDRLDQALRSSPGWLALGALFAGACIPDQDLIPKDGDEPGLTDSAPDTETDPPTEDCNGLDDDGDGLVDDGFPDGDLNGRADCLDVECPALTMGSADLVTQNEACAAERYVPPADPWDIEIAWSLPKGPTSACADTPVVGHLDDDDGDGVIGAGDHPEVLVHHYAEGALVVLDGTTAEEKWRWATYEIAYGHSSALIADVNGDGAPDVLTSEAAFPDVYRMVLLDAGGRVQWRSPVVLENIYHSTVPAVADLDLDGIPEVLVEDRVLSGLDGDPLFSLPTLGTRPFLAPTTADLDLDGVPEILVDGFVTDASGVELWNNGDVGGVRTPPQLYTSWMAPVQADLDPEAEVVSVGSTFSVFDTDGTTLLSVDVSPDYHREGPPCAGDLDGDGEMDIAWPASDKLVAYHLDGSELWQAPVSDVSGMAGCSVFDIDGDGALDVLYASEFAFQIFDGRTGDVRFEAPHSSPTIIEYPTVADLDGDRDAEILVCGGANGDTNPLLTVYSHADDAWAPVGTTWPTHDFPAVDIAADGEVARDPSAYWNAPGMLRGRPYDLVPARPDLTVAITDVCVADCDYGPVQVAVHVANAGHADVPEGVAVALYAVESDGWREIARVTLPAVPAGTALEGFTVDLAAADVGALGLGARVDPDGLVVECDEANDAVTAEGCD